MLKLMKNLYLTTKSMVVFVASRVSKALTATATYRLVKGSSQFHIKKLEVAAWG